MARPQRKRPYVRRRTRRQRRIQASYRHGLKDAIGKLLPGPFFSRWRVVGSKWSPLRVFWVAILMVWSAEQTLQARFGETREVVRSLFPKWPLGKSYTGWYQAQRKWLTPLRPALSQRLRRQLQTRAGRRWQREGWCAFAADGSRVECPRTAANEKALKCAGKKKTGPQLFVTTLWHMGTGVPWDFRIGPGTASERRHLEEMLADVPPRSLLVADAGFTGYEFYGRILAAKQRFLLRVGSNVHLPKELGYIEQEGRDTVYLWPERNLSEPPVVLRRIERRDGKKKMVLVTNVLGPKGVDGEERGGVVRDALGGGSFLPVAETDAGKASDAEPDARGGDVRTDVGDDGPVAVGTDDGVGDLGAGRRPVGLVGGPGARTGAAKHAPCFDAAARGSRLSTTALHAHR